MSATALKNPVTIEMHKATEAGAAMVGADDLRDLMQAVNETTERLQRTHITLQQEVARLQGELAEANAQLRRSRSLAALGEMAAGIAHEIRNPLGSIQLYAQMLGDDLTDQQPQAHLCEKINRAVIGLDAIVRDVLLFAREMKIRPTPTTARDVVNASIENCAALLANSGIDPEFAHQPRANDVFQIDACLMMQAISNVVRNAIEAMAECNTSSPRLRITVQRSRVRCPDGSRCLRMVIGIEDNGPGITPEIVERMFNPFFTTRKTGTGLGLAIVHRIIDAHGGHINVKRTTIDGSTGARVELCLPIEPNEEPSQS